jgi:formamidase
MRSSAKRLVASFILAAPIVMADAALAGDLRIPVIRDANGIPIPCMKDPKCHNRFHPAIPPVAFADPGDVVVFETRDAFDNQFNFDSRPTDVAGADASRIHPLTGPVFVRGAGPGDVLEVTLLSIEPGPDRFGYTVLFPGFGFLRDLFTAPDIARWRLRGGFARSPDMPGIRIPANGFPGTIGVAPDASLVATMNAREAALAAAGGFVLLPDTTNATPAAVCGPGGSQAANCLRTIPPRENGGNMDVKQMVKGTRLLFPCYVQGCLLSVGDVHYAQGDGEVAGTAIEMNATVKVKLAVRRGQAFLLGNRPAFEGGSELKKLAPEKFYATVGYPLKAAGEVPPTHQPNYFDPAVLTPLENLSEDLTLAARDALRRMIDYLVAAKGLTPHQAYVLTSVAVDLRIANLVDVPNYTVSAQLPLEVFVGHRRRGDRDDDDD